jgi:hypothetical protein
MMIRSRKWPVRDGDACTASYPLVIILCSIIFSWFSADALYAQPTSDLLARFKGSYSGTVHRAVTGSLGPDTGSTVRGFNRDDQALLHLSVSAVNGSWRVDLRHTAGASEAPLPGALTFTIPKSIAALSPVRVDGLPDGWAARATESPTSMTLYLVETNASLTPTQFQILLKPDGTDVTTIIWRIDQDGRRATAWRAILSPQAR